MRISTTPNVTPKSTPPSSTGSRGGADVSAGDEQFIWRSLVPRLVHPARLQIVEALIDKGAPMTIAEMMPLISLADGNTDLLRYHAKAMIESGVLAVVDASQMQVDGHSDEDSLFFSLPK